MAIGAREVCESCRHRPVEVTMRFSHGRGEEVFYLCRVCAAFGAERVSIHEAVLQVCNR